MHSTFFLFWAVAFFVSSVIAALFQEIIVAGFLIGIAKFFLGVGFAVTIVRAIFTLLGGNVRKDAS